MGWCSQLTIPPPGWSWRGTLSLLSEEMGEAALGDSSHWNYSADSVLNGNGNPEFPVQPLLPEPVSLGKALVPSGSTQPYISLARRGVCWRSAQDESTGVAHIKLVTGPAQARALPL